MTIKRKCLLIFCNLKLFRVNGQKKNHLHHNHHHGWSLCAKLCVIIIYCLLAKFFVGFLLFAVSPIIYIPKSILIIHIFKLVILFQWKQFIFSCTYTHTHAHAHTFNPRIHIIIILWIRAALRWRRIYRNNINAVEQSQTKNHVFILQIFFCAVGPVDRFVGPVCRSTTKNFNN